MRINKWIAQAIGMSRRAADDVIAAGRVTVNGQTASLGVQVSDLDKVALDGRELLAPPEHQTIILNKPVGYVCSRDGQGSKTVYDLLPQDLKHLKPVGRLDKESSGLLVMTTDGQLAYELTHPKFKKEKVYEVTLYKPLSPIDYETITHEGVRLTDGPSSFSLKPVGRNSTAWIIIMTEGRNRQIRRTFEALGHQILTLHRTHFGEFQLKNLKNGQIRPVTN